MHAAAALVQWETLQDDLLGGLNAAEALDTELQQLILQVNDAVGTAAAVPKDVVMPCFERMGAIHKALCEEARMLVVRQRLADELQGLAAGYVTVLQRLAKTRRPGRGLAHEQELDARAKRLRDWAPQVCNCGWVVVGRGRLRAITRCNRWDSSSSRFIEVGGFRCT
jgi:hypothetical protein